MGLERIPCFTCVTNSGKKSRMRSDLMNTGGLVIATFNRGAFLCNSLWIDRPIPRSNEIEVDSWVSHVPMAVFVVVMVSSIVLQDTETSSWIGKTGEEQ